MAHFARSFLQCFHRPSVKLSLSSNPSVERDGETRKTGNSSFMLNNPSGCDLIPRGKENKRYTSRLRGTKQGFLRFLRE